MPGRFSVGEWSVDPSLHSVRGPSGNVRLEPKVMLVLVHLAEKAGQVVPKQRLLQDVWADTFVGDEVLSRAISELRRVFGDDAKTSRFIQTIPKGSYRLVAPVRFDSREGPGDPATQDGVATPTPRTRPAPPAPTPRSVRVVPFTTFPGVEDSPSFHPTAGGWRFTGALAETTSPGSSSG